MKKVLILLQLGFWKGYKQFLACCRYIIKTPQFEETKFNSDQTDQLMAGSIMVKPKVDFCLLGGGAKQWNFFVSFWIQMNTHLNKVKTLVNVLTASLCFTFFYLFPLISLDACFCGGVDLHGNAFLLILYLDVWCRSNAGSAEHWEQEYVHILHTGQIYILFCSEDMLLYRNTHIYIKNAQSSIALVWISKKKYSSKKLLNKQAECAILEQPKHFYKTAQETRKSKAARSDH